MRYCAANISAMDKMYYLVKQVDYDLLSFQHILNDKGLFGPMNEALCDGMNNKLSTVFGEFSEEDFPNDNKSR